MIFLISLISLFSFSVNGLGAPEIPSLKLNLNKPPILDPAHMSLEENNYIFSQLFRGLTRFDGQNQLIFDQAKKCKFKTETDLICELRKEAKWNDGVSIKAKDFVLGFSRLVDPKSQCPDLPLLFGIKNAKEIYEGKLPVSSLGVKAISDSELEFLLTEKDTEFLEKLSSPYFVPFRGSSTNGPYKIKTWDAKHRIELEPFSEYFGGKNPRPNVEVIFAGPISVETSLYEKSVINFIWTLSSGDIPKYRDRLDFFQIAQNRYDYLGFNLRPGKIFEKKEYRRALIQSLNSGEFKKVFPNFGVPGCLGLINPLLDSEGLCQTFVPNQKPLQVRQTIKLVFNQTDGDGLKKVLHWVQEQWMSQLGLNMALHGLDQKSYPVYLNKFLPDVFAVAVPLNRPSCLAALEKFRTSAPENFVGFSNMHFDNLVRALSHDKLSMSEKASICGLASDILFKEEFVGIPLGQTYVSLLVQPAFKGWTLNSLNQLDLSQLTFSQK